MTRYACFWVENGEIVAPIENLRFDESLYRCFGDQLVALTDFQEFVPDVGTYGSRSLGGMRIPGIVVDGFTETLEEGRMAILPYVTATATQVEL